MHMKPYQDFMKMAEFVSDNIDSQKFDNITDRNKNALLKKYKDRQITDFEKIQMLEWRKTKSLIRELKTFIPVSQIYEISDKHKFLLMLTKEPNVEDKELWNQVRLPFPQIFIDVELNSDDLKGCDRKISGILIRELKSIETEKKENGYVPISVYGLSAYISGISNDGAPFIDRFYFPILTDVNNEFRNIETRYDDKKEARFIKRFIINFILFLKDREVVYIESKRSGNNRKRREKQGKIPLPDSRIIRLTGQLKRYVNSINDSDLKYKLTHRFWVCGHWRLYKSRRYKGMRGKIQLIEPFIKGEGILINKVRRLIPEDNPDDFYYDDIKPLKKSLRSMRHER